MILSIEILFIKARLPWYGVYIPIYCDYLLSKLCFKKGYICLIPILSYTFMTLQTISYQLGDIKFNIISFLLCYVILIIYIYLIQ